MPIPQSVFDNYLDKNGVISQSQISQGSDSQQHLRELLDNKSNSDPNFPRLIDGDFLSGSYARGTKIFPLDDIDVMIVMDGTGLFPIKNGAIWQADIRGSGFRDNPILNYIGENNLLSSQAALRLFQDALSQSYHSSKVSKDGQAINVWFDAYGLGIDVVPCFHVVPRDGTRDVYYIPNGQADGQWMITNPKIDQEISDTLHNQHNEKLKPVVRLLKLWNRNHNAEAVRSYHLEAICWYIFNQYPEKINDYEGAIRYFFENSLSYFEGNCSDPTQLGAPIDSYLSPVFRSATIEKNKEAQAVLRQASMHGFFDKNQEIKCWQRLFGNGFAV